MNRARVIGIVLSRFSKRFSAWSDLVDALRNQDTAVLTTDDLLQLRTILPSDQESMDAAGFISRRSSSPSSNEKLTPPEEFVVATLSEPNLTFFLDTLLFRGQYTNDSAVLGEKLLQIRDICDQICEDARIKTILSAVLQLGNLMNYEYGNSQRRAFERQSTAAIGFRVETLLKLKDVKSRDGKATLIHYLVEMLSQSSPAALGIVGAYPELKQARHWNSNELLAQKQEILTTLNKIKSYKPKKQSPSYLEFQELRVQPLVQDATVTMDLLQKTVDELLSSWRKTCVYFGEEVVELSDRKLDPCPEFLFNTLDYFFQQLQETMDALEQSKRRKEQQQQHQRKKESDSPSSSQRHLRLNSKDDADAAPIHWRDKLMDEIRTKGSLYLQESQQRSGFSTAEWTPSSHVDVDVDESTRNDFRPDDSHEAVSPTSQHCSECGLPVSQCDCSF